MTHNRKRCCAASHLPGYTCFGYKELGINATVLVAEPFVASCYREFKKWRDEKQ